MHRLTANQSNRILSYSPVRFCVFTFKGLRRNVWPKVDQKHTWFVWRDHWTVPDQRCPSCHHWSANPAPPPSPQGCHPMKWKCQSTKTMNFQNRLIWKALDLTVCFYPNWFINTYTKEHSLWRENLLYSWPSVQLFCSQPTMKICCFY